MDRAGGLLVGQLIQAAWGFMGGNQSSFGGSHRPTMHGKFLILKESVTMVLTSDEQPCNIPPSFAPIVRVMKLVRYLGALTCPETH